MFFEDQPIAHSSEIVTNKRPHHEHFTVRKINKAQNPVNHRVTQSDERVNRTERYAINELLEEFVDS